MYNRKRSRCETQESCLTQDSTAQLINDPPASCVGVRHLQVLLLFLCMMFAYIIRVNISLAIVAITRDLDDTDNGNGAIYDWSTSTKSVILSAFFWGYLVMNLPAAVIGHKVNNKHLLGWSFAVASILSILTPPLMHLAPKYSHVIMVVIRICQGLSQGFMMPMVHGLLSRWGPPRERARFATFVLVGLNFGSMLVLACSGLLASTPWGWPSIFYFSGGLGLVWVILWMLLGGNSPESHSFISDEERDYILKSLPGTAREGVSSQMVIPWKQIWKSGPVWAVTLAHMGQNWGVWTILTEIPTYFSEALDVNLQNDGLITAFPFLLMWIVSFPLSYLADQLIIRGYTSVTASRKIWNSVAHWGGGAALLGMAFAGKNSTLAFTLYTISITLNCCVYMGFNVNHLDLSPNFARILMGISNGSANITAIIAPLFVGAVIKDESKIDNWRIVFVCSAFAFFLANAVFLYLGSGELQPWNDTDSGASLDPESKSRHRTDKKSSKEEKI
ncbi:putative inorganic phosphate cotransporter [Macrosteles quadrilineatus]|uniref:putative inorganic phosphate cotransporter n=1 Tax=Macrosteles quadrilineatus TaxID=74068 RepID=UPI0023E1F6FA|nr:putative inorganic phosphate cotransporter [Macrosteles quadrilineatus]